MRITKEINLIIGEDILLTLSLGQRLCVKFSDSITNFLTTLCSHMDLSGSYNFHPSNG